MAEGGCCWLGPTVEHLCLDGIPCRDGQSIDEARAERLLEAERRAWEREHNPQGLLLGPKHPDREPLADVKPLPKVRLPRMPRVGPPPMPEPGSELVARLEVAMPSSTFEWGEQVRGWEAVTRYAQAMSAQAITGLEHALAAQDEAMDVPPKARDAQAVVDEVAHLCQCSPTTATRKVDAARALGTRLPQTWTALVHAQTSWGAVCGLIDATEELTHAQAALVEADLWPAKHHHTPSQVSARTRTLITRHAPGVVARRREAAAARREARLLRGPLGGTDLVELEAPAEEMAGFWADVETLVTRRKADGPLGRQRLDAIFRAVRCAADDQRTQPGFNRSAAARRGVVHVHLDYATLFGLAAEPGKVRAGATSTTLAVPADTARQMAWDLIADGAPVERILIHTTTGHAAQADLLRDLIRKRTRTSTTHRHDQDPTSPHLTVDLDRQLVARDQGCIEHVCDLPPEDCDRDHNKPLHLGGASTRDGVDLRCRTHHRHKQHPAKVLHRLHLALGHHTLPITVTTTRTGHTWTTRPIDLRE